MNEKIKEIVELFKQKTAKECYKIILDEGEPDILDDKIGGNPYLPIGEIYPMDENGNPFLLLLQVNLEKIDLENYPKKGILEIYMESELNWPCNYQVRYFESELEYQTELPKNNMEDFIVQEPIKIRFEKAISYLSINDYRFADIVCNIVYEIYGKVIKGYGELNDFLEEIDKDWYNSFIEINGDLPIIFGGYPDFTQADPRNSMKENKDECIFKLDSVGNYNKFYIGDTGILFALISKEDLEKCNFEKTFIDWDCC